MILDPAEIAGLLPFEKRYELRRQRWLGGPHGSWEAFDRVLEREVIVNAPWGHTNLPRFIRTAKLTAALRHPNILPILDLGVSEGQAPYYTTPPVPPSFLDHCLFRYRNGEAPTSEPFPLRWFVRAVRDACRAIEHAHRRGLLHLDLNPGSILILEEDHFVLDINERWRARDRDGCGSDEPGRFGRPAFLSPEQASAMISTGPHQGGFEVGPQADVFGLGGILHVILFGSPPNQMPGQHDFIELLRAIAERRLEPRRPGTLGPELDRHPDRKLAQALVPICMSALAYEPSRRYQRAADLADALEECLEKSGRGWRSLFGRSGRQGVG